MYILSENLLSKITSATDRAKAALPELAFDEYIAIPAYGTNVILRFEYVGAEPMALDKLDALESRLREAVGSDFMANLMGDASRQCGLDLSKLNEILVRIDAQTDAAIPACKAHRDGLTADSQAVRARFGLSESVPFWEIQANPDGLLVLALHPADKRPPFSDRGSAMDGHPVRVHFLPDDGSFRGLMKAAALAAEGNVSITHILLDHSKQP